MCTKECCYHYNVCVRIYGYLLNMFGFISLYGLVGDHNKSQWDSHQWENHMCKNNEGWVSDKVTVRRVGVNFKRVNECNSRNARHCLS